MRAPRICGALALLTVFLVGCEGNTGTSPSHDVDRPLLSEAVGDCPGGCTQTQGGWGSAPRAGNAGEFLHDNFAGVFPSGIIVGDPDGPDADGLFAIRLTSAQAVTDYMPSAGTPAALTADLTDPLSTSSGLFGGQLVAATINVAFDAAGLRRDGSPQPFPAGTLGTLVYVDGCVDDDLVGLSVNDVIALANTAISGGGTPAGVTILDLSDALVVLNHNFVDCDADLGCLAIRPIEGILMFFDMAVDADLLEGIGPAMSAQNRLEAVRNMIQTAADYIAAEMFTEACQQLEDVLGKIDGAPKPPDLVGGAVASELALLIQALRVSLGCM